MPPPDLFDLARSQSPTVPFVVPAFELDPTVVLNLDRDRARPSNVGLIAQVADQQGAVVKEAVAVIDSHRSTVRTAPAEVSGPEPANEEGGLTLTLSGRSLARPLSQSRLGRASYRLKMRLPFCRLVPLKDRRATAARGWPDGDVRLLHRESSTVNPLVALDFDDMAAAGRDRDGLFTVGLVNTSVGGQVAALRCALEHGRPRQS